MSMDRRAFVRAALLAGGALAAYPGVGMAQRVLGQTAPQDYSKPFIDTDEWRDEPVRHRYVHGGFEDTELRFSMYFPEKEKYEGRFFQPLAAISGNENAAPMAMFQASGIGFAADSGGYLVESNQGARDMFGGSAQANAAVAEYSRVLAQEMYGGGRPYGYVYGGSGGAFKTFGCMETTEGVWDGFVPFVHGTPVAIPASFTVQAHAFRVLWDKLPGVVEALEPGGSGNMFEGMNSEEREAMLEVTRFGMPPRIWFNRDRIAFGYTGVFSSLLPPLIMGDPSYFTEFWEKPGYLGAAAPASLVAARVQEDTTIAELIMPEQAREMGLPLTMAAGQVDSGATFPAGFRFADMPSGDLMGAGVTVTSGAAEGTFFTIAGVRDGVVLIGFGADAMATAGLIKAGDSVRIDNSNYLAAQTYHRHIDPGPEYALWEHFRGPYGNPIYPQRPNRQAVAMLNQTGGSSQSGEIRGKAIVMQAMLDEAAYPWGADWYRKRVMRRMGEETDNVYRLYFVDNTMHTTQVPQPGDPLPLVTTRVISYQGVLQQILRSLADWVEKGVPPPAGTNYTYEDGQILLPDDAETRLGLQPVVTVSANGGVVANVKAGEAVNFSADLVSPPGSAPIVSVEWDFDGYGNYPDREDFPGGRTSVTATTTHAFDTPGTYFPSVRVSANARRDPDSPFARMQNIGRVRVVVS